jgi:hypothetical protein
VDGLAAAPRKRGHSKNGRSDAPQIVVGMAVTRDGFPVRHWVFPGNTVDVTTVARVKEDLRGWQLTRCLFVGDAGMVSQANLQTLSKGGGKYLLAMPMRRGDEVTEEVLSRPGRYRTVAENLEVKEVIVGAGERRRRYAVCFNPLEAKRQKAHREELLHELEAELASLSDLAQVNHTKRVCALRSSARYGRLLKETKRGLAIDRQAVAELERFDGKFVVHSNDDTLTAEDMALGYKQQQRVEEAWRTMKSGLKMRPVFHWAPHRIHAHIAITVLSLLLERTVEHACQDTWRNIRDDLKHIQLALLSSPNGRVWQVTEPSPDAAKRLKALNIKPPKPILNGYFGISEYYRPIPELDEWLRRRVRMCYWKQWRLCRTKISHLLALGVDRRTAILTGVSGKSYWHLSRSKATQVGMTNDWLRAQGLVSIRDLWMKAHGYA